VLELYDDGMMASEIHQYAEQYFGQKLPCDDGQECPYKQGWDFESDEYDVLIGHYQHAHNPDITAGRVAVFDEFPADAFLLEFEGDTVRSAVSAYVSEEDSLPFEDFTELVEGRNSEEGKEAREWVDANDLKRDSEPVLKDASGSANAYAPLLTYAVLVGENLGNGWEHADLDKGTGIGNHRRAARNRESGKVFLLLPPELDDASGVITLDGTPTPALWQLAVDSGLNYVQVLSDEERADYLTHALDYSIVQTAGDAALPYSSGTYVNPEKEGLLFEAVAEREETEPALISTAKAITQYEQEDVLAPIGKHEHYGNLKGSNQFEKERVGIVAGSQHYGDDYPKMWGALAGRSVERGDGKGMDLDYGEFGNKVLRHMREYEVLQAVLRFGRNEFPTTLYVHTAALPEWVPVEAKGQIERWSKGVQAVVEVLENDAPDEWRTSDVAEQVSISKRQVRTNLSRLAESGYIEKRKEGRGYTWVVTDEAIDQLGQVEFRSS
jgi:DNA-binding transcriptional ArsR family regulator